MTDKQIIIDGVDVSGCEYYNKDDKTCREVNGNYDTDICEFDKCENSNCYYKQLKRKEQECEKLKEAIDGLLKIQYQLADSCTKYEQTLTEIKEIAEDKIYIGFWDEQISGILQKIRECEAENEN